MPIIIKCAAFETVKAFLTHIQDPVNDDWKILVWSMFKDGELEYYIEFS